MEPKYRYLTFNHKGNIVLEYEYVLDDGMRIWSSIPLTNEENSAILNVLKDVEIRVKNKIREEN